MSRFIPAFLFCFSLAASASAQAPDVRAEWNAPVEPFRIFGPLYYVGTKEVASFAIKTPEGLVILDGGLPESAPRIVTSLEKLGLRIQDAKILLNSHSHFDHAGGLAELKEKSGARMMASERDAAQLESGGKGDFAWGDANLFPPVKVDRKLRDGDTISLGGITLTAHVTAGHTKGCTTWTATFEEKGERLRAVFYCSTTVPDPENYHLAGNPRYPEIAADYEKSFAVLRDLPCDLFLAAHGSFFDLEKKAERLRAGDRHAFVDPQGFRALIEKSEKTFRKLLTEARAAAVAPGRHFAILPIQVRSPEPEGRNTPSASRIAGVPRVLEQKRPRGPILTPVLLQADGALALQPRSQRSDYRRAEERIA